MKDNKSILFLYSCGLFRESQAMGREAMVIESVSRWKNVWEGPQGHTLTDFEWLSCLLWPTFVRASVWQRELGNDRQIETAVPSWSELSVVQEQKSQMHRHLLCVFVRYCFSSSIFSQGPAENVKLCYIYKTLHTVFLFRDRITRGLNLWVTFLRQIASREIRQVPSEHKTTEAPSSLCPVQLEE